MAQYYAIRQGNNSELYHYGVKGMRWGHRKSQYAYGTEDYYREKAQRLATKVDTSKTRLGKSVSNYRSYKNERKANIVSSLRNEKGLGKKIDNLIGYGRAVSDQKAAANYYDRKAGYVKTKLGKTMTESRAYNERSYADANTKTHNSKNVKEFGKNFVEGVANTKIKTWSGRTITNGENIVDNMLTGGTFGLIQDVGHYVSSSKTDSK